MSLRASEKFAYGIGAVGKDMVYALVAGFLLYYLNVTLGISASFIGVILMIARAFDAFNDPFMGVIVEKTNTRFGRFRPWILIGTLLNALVLVCLYSIPRSFSGTALLWYSSALYFLWGITYTIMDIPYWSMIPAITESGKDRESLSVIARSCAGFGYAIPTALTMTAVAALANGDVRAGFSRWACVVAVFFAVSQILTVAFVRERGSSGSRSVSVKELLIALARNDQALVIVLTIIIFNASLYLTQNLSLYFFKYDIGRETLYGVFGTIGGASQIIAMLCFPLFRKKFASTTVFVVALCISAAGYALLFALSCARVVALPLLSAAAAVIFFGFGLATVLTTIFLADAVDYGEWKNGRRNESVVFSLQTFVVKLAAALSVLIAGVGIDAVGIDPSKSVQSPAALMGIRFLMTIVPMLGLALAAALFKAKYKLTEKFLRDINSARKNGEEVPS